MFDHYIAVDWAQRNMAIARMTGKSDKICTIDVPSSVKELQVYLGNLRGSKCLTFEESTASQWLYTELNEHVSQLIVCDPYRNYLLREGAKNDRIDAGKMVQMLRANLLKPVFHSGDQFILLRKIISGYEDLVKAGTRLKNQRSALFRACGKDHKGVGLNLSAEKFVLEGLDRSILVYEEEKLRYEQEFKKLSKEFLEIRLLQSIPGIGIIPAVQIVAQVVDPRRFPSVGHFLSYCGLVKLEKMSGGKSYGKRTSRYCRTMKRVFKLATFTCIQNGKNNPMRDYYLYLIHDKKIGERAAGNAVARKIATLTLGVLKTKKKFDPFLREKKKLLGEKVESTLRV